MAVPKHFDLLHPGRLEGERPLDSHTMRRNAPHSEHGVGAAPTHLYDYTLEDLHPLAAPLNDTVVHPYSIARPEGGNVGIGLSPQHGAYDVNHAGTTFRRKSRKAIITRGRCSDKCYATPFGLTPASYRPHSMSGNHFFVQRIVPVGVGVALGVRVGVAVALLVELGVAVALIVSLGVAVALAVALGVTVALAVGLGVAAAGSLRSTKLRSGKTRNTAIENV